MIKKFLVVLSLLMGILFPVTLNADATTCLNLSNEKLIPMSFTITDWTSNGITKEYIDSSYRSYGSFGVEPWAKNSNYLPASLLEKLNQIPANEKNIEVWFEKSSSDSFLESKKIGWAAFPSVYQPYLEVDTVIFADAGDWIRFVTSVQIKDCGPKVILYSTPAQYPFGKITPIAVETIKDLREGIKNNPDGKQILFDRSGVSPWHFLTTDSIVTNFQGLFTELNKPRKVGEHFLIPSGLGFQNQIRLTIRPVAPTDCLGFEFNNLVYTSGGWDIFFSKLPCQVMVIASLPPRLYLGPPLPASPTSNYTLDCFDCYTSVTIAKTTVSVKMTESEAISIFRPIVSKLISKRSNPGPQDAESIYAEFKEEVWKLGITEFLAEGKDIIILELDPRTVERKAKAAALAKANEELKAKTAKANEELKAKSAAERKATDEELNKMLSAGLIDKCTYLVSGESIIVSSYKYICKRLSAEEFFWEQQEKTLPTPAELKAKQEAEAKAAADKAVAEKIIADAKLEAARILAEAKAAVLKKTSITCVKGTLTKKITAVNPKCPSGYKKK